MRRCAGFLALAVLSITTINLASASTGKVPLNGFTATAGDTWATMAAKCANGITGPQLRTAQPGSAPATPPVGEGVICFEAPAAPSTSSTTTSTSTSTSTTVVPTTSTTTAPTVPPNTVPGAPGCGLAAAAFCETFDAATGNPATRSGDLDPTLWGVSRTGTVTNTGQQQYNEWWKPTGLPGCPLGVAPQDVRICNGRVVEGVNDGARDNVTHLALYPKQPADWTSATSTNPRRFVFDVSADSQGPHAAWPEFWITDLPVPTPAEGDLRQIARNSFGFAIAGCNGSNTQTGVTMVATSDDYVHHDYGSTTQQGCILRSTPGGALNHFQVELWPGGFRIFGTDPGKPTELKLLASGAIEIPFTRGVIWLEDVHYNACKFDAQCDHSFAWDNVGFDGPKLYRDLTFDVPDANTPGSEGRTVLGYELKPNEVLTLRTALPVTVQQTPTAAYVTLNWSSFNRSVPEVRVNGGAWVQMPYPFAADDPAGFWETVAIPISFSDVMLGARATIEFRGAQAVISNVNLTLINAAPVP